MRYGSVCSGIEAASVAWEPLGWKAAWFAEVEPFPSSVLAHHWPDVANLGDMTRLARRVMLGEIKAPDVLVGGTPCQAFSVAGMREGLADDRGLLTMKYVELADAIDAVRVRRGNPESIVVWENVPGVLSDRSNAFGCFLGALAGEDRELQPSGKRWTNAGCVYGPQRAIAWRVLDAQYFGVAQRRRRVFVVASARADIDPAAILFEREGVRRDTAPRREAGQDAAQNAGKGSAVTSSDVSPALLAKGNSSHRTDAEAYVAAPIKGFRMAAFGDYADDETASTMKTRDYKDATDLAVSVALRGREGGATADLGGDVATALRASSGGGDKGHALACSVTGDITHTLNTANSGKGGSEDGTGRGVPTIAMSVTENQRAECRLSDRTYAVTSGGGKPGQGCPAVLTSIAFPSRMSGTQQASTTNLSPSLGAANPTAVAFSDVYNGSISGAVAPTIGTRGSSTNASGPTLMHGLAVRRLTPVECERLQGFPDNWTNVPYRNKPASDGPRYKAIGNSMAVPVMQWIGLRIQMVQEAAS